MTGMKDNAGAIINYPGYIFYFRYKVKMTEKTSITWSATCVIINSAGAGKFATTYTKIYVLVVILST